MFLFFFFFNDTATTEIYTLSLHDALPICRVDARHLHELHNRGSLRSSRCFARGICRDKTRTVSRDRKSTRLNSSHLVISYAVFCLKKKKSYDNTNGSAQDYLHQRTRFREQ